MRAITGTGDAIGDLIWEGSRHGELGWATGVAGTRAGASPQRVMMWGDSVCAHVKKTSDVLWTQVVRAGKVPSGLIGTWRPGDIEGGYWGGWGGQSSTRAYTAQYDRVIRSDDGGDTWANTSITGFPVYANEGPQRAFGPKGATDDQNADVFYIGMGGAKMHVSLDGGATKTQPASLPAPSAPSDTLARYTCVAVDEGSSMTGGGTSRRSRVAASPCGQGVWLSTDGGVTFTDVTGSSGVTAVSNLAWVNGKLFASSVNAESGNAFGSTTNLKKYDPAGGTWTDVAHGMELNGDFIQFIMADPRYTNGYWAFTSGGVPMHTQNGASFVNFYGLGGTAPNKHYIYAQTQPEERPLLGKYYRYTGAGGAISCGAIVDGRMYLPQGFAVISTVAASFPTAGADYTTPFGPLWPTWRAEVSGIEEIVGQNVEWIYNTVDSRWDLWCGGQDRAATRWEDGSRGHLASTITFPIQRSDSHSMLRGGVPGFAALRRTREDNGTPAFSFTLDGKTWQKCNNQPPQPDSAVYECGIGLAHGVVGQLSVIPTRAPGVPMHTADAGSTPWIETDFYIDATKLDFSAWKSPSNTGQVYNGFQGSNFANQHHNACLDPVTGDAYCVNIGATDNEGTASWAQQPDPKGWAGIYRMAHDEFGVYRRIHAGHPAFTANFAYFDCKLIADGAGHLVFIPNYLPGNNPTDGAASTGVHPVLYTIAGDVLTQITSVWNAQCINFGAPYPGDTSPCLWFLAWGPGGWGYYYSRDLGVTAKGPFSIAPGGYNSYFAAHPAEWGVIATPKQANGHALGRFKLTA